MEARRLVGALAITLMAKINARRTNAKSQPAQRRRRDARPGAGGDICTVRGAADRLKLHPKTILRFIREGRLRATRIGKSYRILRADLDAFAGVPTPSAAPAEAAWVTSIVDVPGVAPELAQKWARTVTAALNARSEDSAGMRADVVYEPDRTHLKIVLVGSPGDAVRFMSAVRVWLEQLKPDR